MTTVARSQNINNILFSGKNVANLKADENTTKEELIEAMGKDLIKKAYKDSIKKELNKLVKINLSVDTTKEDSLEKSNNIVVKASKNTNEKKVSKTKEKEVVANFFKGKFKLDKITVNGKLSFIEFKGNVKALSENTYQVEAKTKSISLENLKIHGGVNVSKKDGSRFGVYSNYKNFSMGVEKVNANNVVSVGYALEF